MYRQLEFAAEFLAVPFTGSDREKFTYYKIVILLLKSRKEK